MGPELGGEGGVDELLTLEEIKKEQDRKRAVHNREGQARTGDRRRRREG